MRQLVAAYDISIHALREEGDDNPQRPAPSYRISIHALREEGDAFCARELLLIVYFYPRPPRGGRLAGGYRQRQLAEFLSTPSARRATRCAKKLPPCPVDFYPRPPRGGRRSVRAPRETAERFLSTPSARRATLSTILLSYQFLISIHALREEGDL